MATAKFAALGLLSALGLLLADGSASAQSRASSATDGTCDETCRQQQVLEQARRPLDEARARDTSNAGFFASPGSAVRDELNSQNAERLLAENVRALAIFDNSGVLRACEQYMDQRSAILGTPRFPSSCDTYKEKRERFVAAITNAREYLALPEPTEARVVFEEQEQSDQAVSIDETDSSTAGRGVEQFDPNDWRIIKERIEIAIANGRSGFDYEDDDTPPDPAVIETIGDGFLDPRRRMSFLRLESGTYRVVFRQWIHCSQRFPMQVEWYGDINGEGKWLNRRSRKVYRPQTHVSGRTSFTGRNVDIPWSRLPADCFEAYRKVERMEWANGWRRYANLDY